MQVRIIAAIFLLMALGAPTTVHADGISIQDISLAQVVSRGGGAAVVTVHAIHANNGRSEAEVEVKRIWKMKGQAPACELRQRCRLSLPQEPQMSPGKWLAVERYWALIEGATLKPGAQVIAMLEHQSPGAGISAVIADSAANRRKLELFFTPGWEAKHAKKSTTAQLARDLADFDLYENARKELARRKKLTNKALWDAGSERHPHDLLAEHVRDLSTQQRSLFLRKTALRLKRKPSPVLKALLYRHYNNSALEPSDLPSMAVFFATLDFADSDDASIMYDLVNRSMEQLKTKAGQKYVEDFLSAYARYIPLRPHYGEVDKPIHAYVGLLSATSRSKLLVLLMDALLKSKPGKVDELSFSIIAKNIAMLPPRRLRAFAERVQPLIDADGYDGCDQIGYLVSMIVYLGAKPGFAKAMAPLAKRTLPQYKCNVDRPSKAVLESMAQ